MTNYDRSTPISCCVTGPGEDIEPAYHNVVLGDKTVSMKLTGYSIMRRRKQNSLAEVTEGG